LGFLEIFLIFDGGIMPRGKVPINPSNPGHPG
jgi:hypothetical protein